MKNLVKFIKRNWWPISAFLFCPCHLPLSMGLIAFLTSGTTIGALFMAQYTAIETVLAVTFSIYFVTAFLIWIVRVPKADATSLTGQRTGFTTRQTITWGTGSALLMPTFVLSAFMSRNGLLEQIVEGAKGFDLTNSGFIWLVSISAIVMIPIMVVWIAWMWMVWSKADPNAPPEKWEKEYEHDHD